MVAFIGAIETFSGSTWKKGRVSRDGGSSGWNTPTVLPMKLAGAREEIEVANSFESVSP